MNPKTFNTCTECPFFKRTETPCIGRCEVLDTTTLEFDRCVCNRQNMTYKAALVVLHYYAKWRRCNHDMTQPNGYVVGLALDKGINALRKLK